MPIRSPASKRLLAALLIARPSAEGGGGAACAGDAGPSVASVSTKNLLMHNRAVLRSGLTMLWSRVISQGQTQVCNNVKGHD